MNKPISNTQKIVAEKTGLSHGTFAKLEQTAEKGERGSEGRNRALTMYV